MCRGYKTTNASKFTWPDTMDFIFYGNDSISREQMLLREKWPHKFRSEARAGMLPSRPSVDDAKKQRCFVCGVELSSQNYVDHIQSASHRLNLKNMGGSSGGSKFDFEIDKTDEGSTVGDENRSHQHFNGNEFHSAEPDGNSSYYRSLWTDVDCDPRNSQPPLLSMALQHPRTDALLAEALAQLSQLRAERAARVEQAERSEREKRNIAWRRRQNHDAGASGAVDEDEEAIESSRSGGGGGSSSSSRRHRIRCDSAAESDTMLMVVTPLETGRTDATGTELMRRRSARGERDMRDAAVATDAVVEQTVLITQTPPASKLPPVVAVDAGAKVHYLDFASQMPTPRVAPVAAIESNDCACGTSDSEVAAINNGASSAVQEKKEVVEEVQQAVAIASHRSREVERMQAALELSLQADQVDDVIREVDARIAELLLQAEALQAQIVAEEAVREELQQKRLEILQRRVDVLKGCFELPVNENFAAPYQELSVDYGFYETDNTGSPPPAPAPPLAPDCETDAEAALSGCNSDIQRRTLVQRVLLDDFEASAATALGGGPLAVDSPRDVELIQRTLDRLTALPPQHPQSLPAWKQQQQQEQQQDFQSQQPRSGRRRSRGQRREATEPSSAEVLSDVMSAAPRDPPSRPASAGGFGGGCSGAYCGRRTASETRIAVELGNRNHNDVEENENLRRGSRQHRRRISGGRCRDDPAFTAALREYLHAASSSGGGSASSDADAESSVDHPSMKPIRLEAHPGAPVLCSVSHDGLLYTGSTGGAGSVLCLATRRRLAELICGGGGVIYLTLCDSIPDRLVACSTSGAVSLHAARSGRQLAIWRLPGALCAARARWDCLWMGMADGQLATFDQSAPAAEPVRTGWPAFSEAITALELMATDSGDRRIIVGLSGGAVRLLDQRNGSEITALGGHARYGGSSAAVFSIRYGRDRLHPGQWICSVSESAALIHRPSEQREAVWLSRRIPSLAEPTVRLTSMETFGHWLLLGCSDGSVRCYTVNTGDSSHPATEATILIGSRRRPIASLAICPPGRLACGDALGRVELRRIPATMTSIENDDDDDVELDDDTPTSSSPQSIV